MRFANYGRKSVFSDKSDSIDNQFRMCRDYCEAKFSGNIESWVQYSDEDFSGSNTERPDLKRLMADIKDGIYDALVVYQLDRLSRDVRDFANIYDVLEEHGVMFISIKENIDTTTPIGRAMMYVTVVFAQMERETIAARVTDNMIGLARKGLWAGGKTPVGYRRKNIVLDGRKHVTIDPDPEEAEYLKWLFNTFLENGYTISSMRTEFLRQGHKTLRGYNYGSNQLYTLLSSPFCVEATQDVYDYFCAKGCQIDPGSPREKWDGSVGVMVYGRHSESGSKYRVAPPEKWTVSLGLHKPIIKSETWLAVQDRFKQNTFCKTAKYEPTLLKGIVRCSCGSKMKVSRTKRKSGIVSAYVCQNRDVYGSRFCQTRSINAKLLDEKVLSIFRQIEGDQSLISQYMQEKDKSEHENFSKQKYQRQAVEIEQKINRLTSSIALDANSSAVPYIIKEIESLDSNLRAVKRELDIINAEEQRNKERCKDAADKAAEITKFIKGVDQFSPVEQNEIAKSVIKECVWDGETLFVKM